MDARTAESIEVSLPTAWPRFQPALSVALALALAGVPVHHDALAAQDARARLIAALRARREAVTALRGRAQLVVSAPEWDGASQAEAAVVARRPASLRLRAWVGPSTLFDLTGVADTCSAHVVRYGAWARGPCADLNDITGVPADPEDVVAALFEPYFQEDSLVIEEVGDEVVTASWPAPRGARIHGRFRREGFVPLSYEWKEGDRVRARLRYDDFVRESFGPWPRDVQVEWPEKKALLRLHFHELDLDPEFEDDPFAMIPPEGTRLFINLGEMIDRSTEKTP
jgi:hypothetical protein